MTMGLVPIEVLSNLQTEAAVQFDSLCDHYVAGPPDGHGQRTYPATPTQVPARFVKRTDNFFTGAGQQSAVSTGFIYLPLGTPVGMLDKLFPSGTGSSTATAPPILEIANRPTVGEPVLLRIRTGSA